MKKVVVWYSIQNGGDGSAYPHWFLTEKESEWDQEQMSEGWGETCNGSVETFEGSDIHKKASENRENNQKLYKAWKEGIKLPKGEYGEEFKSIILIDEDKEDMSFLNNPAIDAWGLNCK